MKSFPAVVI